MNNKIALTDGFFDLRINATLPNFRSKHNKEYELIREVKRLFDKAQHRFIETKLKGCVEFLHILFYCP